MKWISVKDRLPEIGESVLVRTEYNSTISGSIKLCHDTFVGFMAEDGDLLIGPEEDSYGWSFEECVTHWMPLPAPPTEGEDARPTEQVEITTEHHLKTIKILTQMAKGKKVYIECYPTDKGAINFPNSNMAIKEL